jgi:hypothetical protein
VDRLKHSGSIFCLIGPCGIYVSRSCSEKDFMGSFSFIFLLFRLFFRSYAVTHCWAYLHHVLATVLVRHGSTTCKISNQCTYTTAYTKQKNVEETAYQNHRPNNRPESRRGSPRTKYIQIDITTILILCVNDLFHYQIFLQ